MVAEGAPPGPIAGKQRDGLTAAAKRSPHITVLADQLTCTMYSAGRWSAIRRNVWTPILVLEAIRGDAEEGKIAAAFRP